MMNRLSLPLIFLVGTIVSGINAEVWSERQAVNIPFEKGEIHDRQLQEGGGNEDTTTTPETDSLLVGPIVISSTTNGEVWSERQTVTIPFEKGEIERRFLQEESGNEDTTTPATNSPSDGEPMATPAVATTSPTDSVTDAPTDAPVAITNSPTEAPIAVTDTPTEAPVVAEVRATNSPTEEVSMDASDECSTTDHEVMIDLQIDFPGTEVITCSDDENDVISDTIKGVMNDVDTFNSKVPGWIGDDDDHPVFGNVDFDDQQAVDNLSSESSRRLLRGQMLEAAIRLLKTHRREEVLACPLRGPGYPCDQDYCIWGCLEAVVTNCDPDVENDPAQWSNLQGSIKTAVNRLGYACLGNVKDVGVTVEDNTSEAPTPAPVEVRNAEPDLPPFGDVGIEVKITTIVDLTYFVHSGGEFHDGNAEEEAVREELLDVFNEFIERILYNHPSYQDYFNGVVESDVATSWNEAARKLTCTFNVKTYFTGIDEAAVESEHQISHVIAAGDFHKWVSSLRSHKCVGADQSVCNKFMTGIQQVEFTQTGTGRR